MPSGNAMAASVLLRLGGLAVEPRFAEAAREALLGVQSLMGQYPLGFGQWLQALSYALAGPREIALVGDPAAADTRALLAVLREGYRPHQVVAMGDPAEEARRRADSSLPHAGRWAGGGVCLRQDGLPAAGH